MDTTSDRYTAEVGRRVREAIDFSPYTRAQIATHLNVSTLTLRRHLNGTHGGFALPKLKHLSALLGITMADLVTEYQDAA